MTATTMTRNCETVSRGYDAFNAGDREGLERLFAPEAHWHSAGTNRMSGDYNGRDNVLDHFADLGRETKGHFSAELESLAESDDGRVIAIHHNHGERSGRKLDAEGCIVFTLKNGQIVDGREYFEDTAKLDEFWA